MEQSNLIFLTELWTSNKDKNNNKTNVKILETHNVKII